MDKKKASKLKSEKSLPMIKGGGSGNGSGPTAGTRSSPKGGGVKTSAANFLPNKGPRSKTNYLVGGR